MIKLVDDVGAPVAVAALDIITDNYVPEYNKWVGIGCAAVGYIAGGVMGIGGNFLKNLGIASAPWAIESIYTMIKSAQAPVTSKAGGRLKMRTGVGAKVTRWPAPATHPEFDLKPAY